MLMEAKYAGRCAECHGPIQKGERMSYDGKKARHLSCATSEEEERPGSEACRLADELGFRPYDEAVVTDWSVEKSR